jgi:hypothetical protein
MGWPGYDTRIALFTLATVAALAFDAWFNAWGLRRHSLTPTAGETHERPRDRPAPVP